LESDLGNAFLKHKALLLGKEVVVVTEEYTTKGCSRCGLVTEIGGNKSTSSHRSKTASPSASWSLQLLTRKI
jgi:hypothetical protein